MKSLSILMYVLCTASLAFAADDSAKYRQKEQNLVLVEKGKGQIKNEVSGYFSLRFAPSEVYYGLNNERVNVKNPKHEESLSWKWKLANIEVLVNVRRNILFRRDYSCPSVEYCIVPKSQEVTDPSTLSFKKMPDVPVRQKLPGDEKVELSLDSKIFFRSATSRWYAELLPIKKFPLEGTAPGSEYGYVDYEWKLWKIILPPDIKEAYSQARTLLDDHYFKINGIKAGWEETKDPEYLRRNPTLRLNYDLTQNFYLKYEVIKARFAPRIEYAILKNTEISKVDPLACEFKEASSESGEFLLNFNDTVVFKKTIPQKDPEYFAVRPVEFTKYVWVHEWKIWPESELSKNGQPKKTARK